MREPLTRDDDERLHLASHPPSAKTEPAFWFLFSEARLLVLRGGNATEIPSAMDPAVLGLPWSGELYLGTLLGRHCYAAEIPDGAPLPSGTDLFGLRYLHGRLSFAAHAAAMKALHLLTWEKTARYCGRCGARTAASKETLARECPACGLQIFPRLSPAVIVLVERDGKALLARSERFKSGFHSVLAGFVEPGETLEETVRREVEEEVGIRVKNVRYFGSQPWPFPDSLMIGFTAEHESGEIACDGKEITFADWFAPDALPTVPAKLSIARALIDWFVERRLGKDASKVVIEERRLGKDD